MGNPCDICGKISAESQKLRMHLLQVQQLNCGKRELIVFQMCVTDGQKFRQFRTHLHHILVSTVQICKPMIQNNVEKFRPIHGLSFTQQSNFDMLNNFLRNQLKKAASVPDFSSTSVKNGLFEKILLQN